jgi:hypothetical protein
MTYYKVLDEDGRPCHGGVGTWPLPQDGEPGEWLEVTGELVPCKNGAHLCREEDLIHWLGPTIYEAEHSGELVEHDNKVVVRKARLLRQIETWNERTARLFACDCAEHVLHLFEKQYPDDSRVRTAIEVARLYADGKATLDDLRAADSAAYSAAYSAADSAAYSAAYSAADSAADSAAYSAGYRAGYRAAYRAADSAAYSAAYRAGYRAAYSAGYRAGYRAEREWQTQRLMGYLRGEVDAAPRQG